MPSQDARALKWLDKYLRYCDYLGAAMLYLKGNYFVQEPLKVSDIKTRILGHWGTVPGLNFIYAHCNYVIHKHKTNMLFITGPGHGAPAILANLFAEKSIYDYYKQYSLDAKGTGNLLHDFSWPHTPFPSHVTPGVPGSILEGGELGYSLATAYGSVLDNPDLITVAVIGDGESETGPIATAWHSNKFLNPKTSGAVLPIVHINGYKISNPTIFGRMSNDELKALFTGYGYEPLIVDGNGMNKKMMKVMEHSIKRIKEIQKKARSSKKAILKPKWPVILLRSPKGWRGPKMHNGKPLEDSFRAHGVPIGHPEKDPNALEAIEKWLHKYKINELVDKNGRPLPEVLEFVPKGALRMGMNKNAVGGNLRKDLKLPKLEKYEIEIDDLGNTQARSMDTAGEFIRDLYKTNKDNFRLFCPDEAESNKLSAIFEQTNRAFMWPLHKNDEHMDPEGRVMEMLSEHTLQGWMMGYLLTGRHGIFVSYEAFTTIIASMVDQYAKFLKQSFKVKWRKPVASAIYINSSLGWRQDHNGYSHQNPSFVSNVLQKHGEFCQIYYPPDANSMLVALEETLNKKDSISVIVAGKRDLPQWLTLEQAREQAKRGIGVWDWVCGEEDCANPDVVLASAGDYITQETLYAAKLCKEIVPEMKIRYVNVSELTSLCLGDYCPHPDACITENQINQYFTHDKPVVFNYHGYVNDIEQILFNYASGGRFSIHGYREQGSTTTPFDMKIANEVSFYHIAMDMIKQASKTNKKVARKRDKLIEMLEKKIAQHQVYIKRYGDDPPELKKFVW